MAASANPVHPPPLVTLECIAIRTYMCQNKKPNIMSIKTICNVAMAAIRLPRVPPRPERDEFHSQKSPLLQRGKEAKASGGQNHRTRRLMMSAKMTAATLTREAKAVCGGKRTKIWPWSAGTVSTVRQRLAQLPEINTSTMMKQLQQLKSTFTMMINNNRGLSVRVSKIILSPLGSRHQVQSILR